MSEPSIHLAFRFHANFVHSYRGDTPDEAGFGQDIRIIRHLIAVLDRANELGIDVRATWDVDHVFSLEQVMPEHCPDIIAAWQRRVASGVDEIHLMSYDNGIAPAHSAREFDVAIGRAISNERGSGIQDLFGIVPRVVRPQEMMFTPKHLELYPRHGLDVVSLYYSAVPFNGFSNFVPRLSLVEQFNPLTLSMSGTSSTMTLVPAVNHGDIAEQVSLRWWLQRLRRRQLRLAEPVDLLVLIDADADDEFWVGYDLGILERALPAARGLPGLLSSIRDLDFVTYTTVETYLQGHDPVGTVSFGQDTADGSFDGYASWAEKWSSTHLWTGIERSRRLAAHTAALAGGLEADTERSNHLQRSEDARLRAMSTTNFGLSSPVILRTRLDVASEDVATAVDQAAAAFDRCVPAAVAARRTGRPDGTVAEFWLIDHERHQSTDHVHYSASGSRSIVRVPLTGPIDDDVVIIGPDDRADEPAVRTGPTGDTELLVLADLEPYGEAHHRLVARAGPTQTGAARSEVSVGPDRLSNGALDLRFDSDGHPVSLRHHGRQVADSPFVRSAVTYRRREHTVERWDLLEVRASADGRFGWVSCVGSIEVLPGHRVEVRRTFLVAASVDALHVDTHVAYPDTTTHPRSRRRGDDLGHPHDVHWQEVMPCELRPSMTAADGASLRVWKHNALDHMSSYELDHGHSSTRRELDSVNNHITDAWVAVTDGSEGLLVAQSADAATNFAFAPVRTRATDHGMTVRINPFGSYTGRQLTYPTARSRLGRLAALHLASSCRPPAPSHGGHSLSFSLLVAPYAGDAPPLRLRRDAEAFAAPPVLLSDDELIGIPPQRSWGTDRGSGPR